MSNAENVELFRETLQPVLIQRLISASSRPKKRVKGRKKEIKPVAVTVDDEQKEATELVDFIEYLADEIFDSLPADLQSLTYAAIQNDPGLATRYTSPVSSDVLQRVATLLPPSISDSLLTYEIIADTSQLDRLLDPILSSYIAAAISVPSGHAPGDEDKKPEGCEICERTQLPLTYHHLIPRAVHEKVLKRGWHADWQLQSVAWLCRACHSYVHKIASNEELARLYYTTELLLEREDVQKWATWAHRIRWKAK